MNKKVVKDYLDKGIAKMLQFLQKNLYYESELEKSIEWIHRPLPEDASNFQNRSRYLRILYVAMKYDYGNPKQGLSIEENAFLHTLVNMGHQIIRFDFKEIEKKFGKLTMNKMLLETVYRYDPDLMFVVLFKNELDKNVIHEISTQTRTITLNWFCDDHWRFESYSKWWAPKFNWIVTTDKAALSKYKAINYHNVILSMWACNPHLCKKLDLPYIYDVSFVGRPYGYRKKIINQLRKAGINVKVWGFGWRKGRVSQREMVKIFNQSRINLDFINLTAGKKEVKARLFEILGCGGFVLTEYLDDIKNYYDIGKEVVCYQGVDDLIDKIRYYLKHEDERAAIAKYGYLRTIREHTYEKRFKDIFKTIGLDV